MSRKPKPYTFTAEGRPRAKARPRMTRSGRTYTPRTTHDAEHALVEQYDGPLYECPIAIEIDYLKDAQTITITPLDAARHSPLTADVDNLVKLTLDALQLQGGAYTNDRQVVELHASKGSW